MLEILNLMVHQSLGNLRVKKNLICSSVCCIKIGKVATDFPALHALHGLW